MTRKNERYTIDEGLRDTARNVKEAYRGLKGAFYGAGASIVPALIDNHVTHLIPAAIDYGVSQFNAYANANMDYSIESVPLWAAAATGAVLGTGMPRVAKGAAKVTLGVPIWMGKKLLGMAARGTGRGIKNGVKRVVNGNGKRLEERV